MRIIGLDPGLRKTGWGIIETDGLRLRHIDNGHVAVRTDTDMATRLALLYKGLEMVIATHRPAQAAIEEVFVNMNPASTLKLGQARGCVMLAAARAALPVSEYATRFIKKALVGAGQADKAQVRAMVERLLPTAVINGADAADALAVAITHAHMAPSIKAGIHPA